MTRADYEACQAREEASFRSAIEGVTVRALRSGLTAFDFPAVVKHEWRRAGVDTVLDAEVDKTIDQLRSETGWLAMWGTLFSKDKAQRIAVDAAERVYRADSLRKALEEVAGGIGKEVGRRMEIASPDAAEPALQCLSVYLGPRYGNVVARVVGRDAGKEFQINPDKAQATVSTGQLIVEGSEGIAGAVILLMRRQFSNMGARIGQRVVGAVLGRVIAVVAGGVGVILIAKDVWDFRHGVLPIVASEMKSDASKQKVREELAKAASEQISEHMQDIGAKVTDRIIEIWHEFRRNHAKVLEISERNEAFRKFLDSVRPDRLSRLDETVGIVLTSEGEAGVLRRLEDGTLNRAVNQLPVQALEIARETRSLDAALRWADLAPDLLAKVLDHELHRRAAPSEFTKASLARIIALDDRTAIARLAAMKGTIREPLMELEDARLRSLARALDTGDLETLSRYLTGLERSAAQRVLFAVANTPAKMSLISSPGVRDAIIASRDQAAAVGMMLRADGIFDLSTFLEEVGMVREGKISPWLLWQRYPNVLIASAVLMLILFGVLRRMIFGRRQKVIVQTIEPRPQPRGKA